MNRWLGDNSGVNRPILLLLCRIDVVTPVPVPAGVINVLFVVVVLVAFSGVECRFVVTYCSSCEEHEDDLVMPDEPEEALENDEGPLARKGVVVVLPARLARGVSADSLGVAGSAEDCMAEGSLSFELAPRWLSARVLGGLCGATEERMVRRVGSRALCPSPRSEEPSEPGPGTPEPSELDSRERLEGEAVGSRCSWLWIEPREADCLCRIIRCGVLFPSLIAVRRWRTASGGRSMRSESSLSSLGLAG